MSFLGWLFAVVLLLLFVEIIKLVRVFNNRPAIIHEQLNVPPFISLIIPVRNEAKRIVSCLESLSRQDYPTVLFEVIVVNDHSEDETREIVESFTSHNPGFRLLDSPVLPGEWSGKSHACHVGSIEARGDYLCFIDADVTATEALLRDTAGAVPR